MLGPEIDLAPDQETDIIEGTDQTLEIGQLQDRDRDYRDKDYRDRDYRSRDYR